MHASENAILAKVRVMYARRLMPEQYRELLVCRTIEAAAAYLREKTHYGIRLQGVTPEAIHREWLENRLREVRFATLDDLASYARTIHADIYRAILIEREVVRLGHTLSVVADRTNSELTEISPFFARHSAVDWAAVERTIRPTDWLAALEGSPYYEVCRPFVDIRRDTVDTVGLDRALERYRVRALLQLADDCYDGAEGKALMDMLRMRVDLDNIAGIYRVGVLRRQGAATAAAIVTDGGMLNNRQIKALCAATDGRQFAAALADTRYRDAFDPARDDYPELALARELGRVCRKQLRTTTFPSVALLCYDVLLQQELNNIIHIIEGIRYGAAQAAAGMLVGVENLTPAARDEIEVNIIYGR